MPAMYASMAARRSASGSEIGTGVGVGVGVGDGVDGSGAGVGIEAVDTVGSVFDMAGTDGADAQPGREAMKRNAQRVRKNTRRLRTAPSLTKEKTPAACGRHPLCERG